MVPIAAFLPIFAAYPNHTAMKKLLLAFVLLGAAVGLAGCDCNEHPHTVGDTIVGRIWAGDLGFYQYDLYPLDSHVHFGTDGFGTDELRFADDGTFLDRLNIRWEAFDDCIRIDYGHAADLRELYDVRIRSGRLTAELYIGGLYYGRIELYML